MSQPRLASTTGTVAVGIFALFAAVAPTIGFAAAVTGRHADKPPTAPPITMAAGAISIHALMVAFG